MNRRFKIIAIFTVASCFILLRWYNEPKRGSELLTKPVVIATSADFPPFSFIDASGAIVGFDKDLIDEICTRLGLNYRLENMPFESLLPQMQGGMIDIIAAGMSPTPERAARIRFSQPYLEADPLALITRSGSALTSLEDLDNVSVAVNQGYVADMHLSKRPKIKLLRLPSISDALLAMRYGKVEAFVTGSRTVKPLQANLDNDNLSVHMLNGLDESTAFGIAKKRADLQEKINAVISDMRSDGTLDILKKKWNL